MSEGAVWVSHAAHTDFLMTQKCSLTGCVCLLTCGCEMCLLACGCKTCLLPCGYNMCPLACGCKMCLLACGCQMCLPAWGARCLLACGCTGWPLAAYVLIGRDDIAATVQASMALPPEGATPQSSLPLASPVSSLALATPLHHGAGGGASPNRPSLGRTPIRQPQLGTLQGEAHHNAIVLLGAATLCLSFVFRLQQQLLTSQQCSNGRSHSCAGLLFVHALMTKEDTDCMLEATALPDP